jgi:hypothetical protein
MMRLGSVSLLGYLSRLLRPIGVVQCHKANYKHLRIRNSPLENILGTKIQPRRRGRRGGSNPDLVVGIMVWGQSTPLTIGGL